jgi:hypothetical protein
VDQSAGERQPLLLAAGELLVALIRPVGQSHDGQPLVRLPCRDTVQLGECVDLLPGRESLEERTGLQLNADLREKFQVTGPRALAEHHHRTPIRLAQPFDDLQECGFAGAVGSQNAEELAGSDLERDTVESADRAV